MNNLKCIYLVSYNASISNRLSEVEKKKGTYFRSSGNCYQNNREDTRTSKRMSLVMIILST